MGVLFAGASQMLLLIYGSYIVTPMDIIRSKLRFPRRGIWYALHTESHKLDLNIFNSGDSTFRCISIVVLFF